MSSIDSARVALLLYVNRSGSTFLASRLAALPGVVATLESEAVGCLLEGDGHVEDAEQLSGILDGLYGELKFRQWDLPREQLEASLAGATFPLSREAVFRSILRALPGGATARCFMVKAPGILPMLDEILERHPSFRVVHVVRDPRAVYASQRHSISSRTGHPMVRDPVTMGYRWRRFVEALGRVPASQLLEVRYEDMLVDEGATVARVCEFLGVDARMRCDDGGAGYAQRIPETQRHLHALVAKAPDSSRAERWRSELPPGDSALLEKTCRDAMRARGYLPDARPSPAAYLEALPRALAGMTRDIAGRVVRRVRRPDV